jgi:hypothetical protein
MVIQSNFVQNRFLFTIDFENGNPSICSFPGQNWLQTAIALPTCDDKFSLTMDWDMIYTECGFATTPAKIGVDFNGFPIRIYSNFLDMAYQEPLPPVTVNGIIYNLTRSVGNRLLMNVELQDQVNVTGNATINNVDIGTVGFVVDLISET